MATRKIITGEIYSEHELNESGYFKANSMFDCGKAANIDNLLGVRCPTQYLSEQGITHEKEIRGNVYYKKDEQKVGRPPPTSSLICNYDVYENPLEELSVYGKGNNFILVNDFTGRVCVQYKKNNSVMIDECIWGVSKELSKYGFCSFMLMRETDDTDIMKASIDLRLMGLLTQDQVFGLHNDAKKFLKGNKKIQKNDAMKLIHDYDRLYPFIKEKLILCDLEEPPEIMCRKVIKRRESQRTLYPYYKFSSIYPSMELLMGL